MAEAKKKELENPVSDKIQRRFDLVFNSNNSSKSPSLTASKSSALDIDFDISDFNVAEDNSMASDSAKKIPEEIASPSLDLSLDGDLDFELDGIADTSSSDETVTTVAENTAKLSIVPDGNDDGLDFALDFGNDTAEIPNNEVKPIATSAVDLPDLKDDSGFDLDFSLGAEETNIVEESFTSDSAAPAIEPLEASEEFEMTFDGASEEVSEEVSDKIIDEDSTKKTIVYKAEQLKNVKDEFFSLNETTGSTNTSSDMMTSEEAKANIESTIKNILSTKKSDATAEFDLKEISSKTDDFEINSELFADVDEPTYEEKIVSKPREIPAATVSDVQSTRSAHTSFVSDEESTRLQATIRLMREEREEILEQVKTLKLGAKELEQDNLTLKSALDETKIEVSILRKRHMVEIEDMRYTLALNEEKKVMAEEKARAAEAKREKLEQRVRIDFNQVKLREKELEAKLEMLSIDVDSQVHARDQKILELRRKIDALEFNMENVSIKEQKSMEDKRKVEEKLNKIMKTLRHSIKNLEDDIDQADDDSQDDRKNNDQRSKT